MLNTYKVIEIAGSNGDGVVVFSFFPRDNYLSMEAGVLYLNSSGEVTSVAQRLLYR